MKTSKINNIDLLLTHVAQHGYSKSTSISSKIDMHFLSDLRTSIEVKIRSFYLVNRFKSLQYKALGSFLGICSDSLFGDSTELCTQTSLDLLKELNLV